MTDYLAVSKPWDFCAQRATHLNVANVSQVFWVQRTSELGISGLQLSCLKYNHGLHLALLECFL